ncbi:MAG TPA: hypothetical protein VH500_14945, partial [Nitrososphaeraceae archaeon]
MARDSAAVTFVILVLSTLLILSTKLPVYQEVFGKNDNMDLASTATDSCHSQTPQIVSLCRFERSEIQRYNAEAREHYTDDDSPETPMGAIMKHHNEYEEKELGLSESDQNNSRTNNGESNYNESVSPALVGHSGNGPGSGG